VELKPGYRQSAVGPVPADWDVDGLDSYVRSDAPICYGILMPGQHFSDGVLVVKVRDIIGGRVDESNLLRTHPLIDEAYARSRLLPGDVLISIRGSTGRVAIASAALKGANITQDTARVRVKERVAAEFIYHALQSRYAQDFVRLHTIGQAVKGINIRDVRAIAVALPPLPEQQAIAAALSDVDALLGALDRLIAKKRDLKQAAMQQLLTGQTRLPGFSGKWETKQLGEFARIRNDKVMPTQVDPGTLCVELEHVGQGDGRLRSLATANDSSSSKYRFRAGDVLFGRLRPYLRKYWLADCDGICTTEIWPLTVDRQVAFNGFLHAVVQTPQFVDAASISYGTHMPRADWGIVKNFGVRLPPPDEQEAVAAVLADMDAELAGLEQRRDKTRLLKQGMMQELLTGKTRLV
jgi:type I restriction enzyme S subunit